jgi:hypothetical protein
MKSIPQFPDFEHVSEDNIAEIKDVLKARPPEISDLSSGNIWGYRNTLNYRVSRLDGGIVILSKSVESPFFLPPIGAPEPVATMTKCLDYLKENYGKGVVSSVPEGLASDTAANGIRTEEKRDDADYVFRTSDLAKMKGDKYQSKRNFANFFVKTYKYSYEELDAECLKECLELQEKWCDVKRCILFKSLEAENRAIYEMLNNFNMLGLFGAVIRIDGKLQAFSIAERLNPSTAVVHVQKANIEFRGIYQALNRLFCSQTVKDYEYENWEQDIGNPGLRKAKLSYKPYRLLMKYDLSLGV